MANQLGTTYRLVPRNKIPKLLHKPTPVEITEGDWGTYDELVSQVNNARNHFNNRPTPAKPADEGEKDSMILLYQRLLGIAERKKSAIIRNGMESLSASYGQARRQLINNIGQYCSYCEIPLATNLAIEHMLPKSDFPLMALVWDNFLLACPLCNSYKNDKPTRATGIHLSPHLGTHDPQIDPQTPPSNAEEAWIKEAALNSYLWPNDSINYGAFENFFIYKMVKLLYDEAGKEVASEDIPLNQLLHLMSLNQVKFENDAGNTVLASLETPLDFLNPTDSLTLLGELRAGSIQPHLIAWLSHHRLVLTKAPNERGKLLPRTIDPHTFELIERRKYLIDDSSNKNQDIPVTLAEVDVDTQANPNLIETYKFTSAERNEFRARLRSGKLPEVVRENLDDDAYKVDQLKDTITVQANRTEFYIIVDKTYRLRYAFGSFTVSGVHKVQVELHLAPVANPLSARATKVINELKLNNVNPADYANKITDRRMVKRTRTWFIALQSYHRLAQTLTSEPPLQPYNELLATIAETAKATGYWSVWKEVFQSMSANLPPLRRTAVLQFLSNVNHFPGTR
ncbi:MAG TPA: HNH endonuclease [Blastocatellia bacterium]|nr:HNH endonuclease [Blastocatellia bacterium]